ncbi:hypothetical protein JXB37_03100 [candidate division WOR-3 bacterium]|nr:hypothetical protein [candidate division WOR-3 bacterium]
MIYRHWFIAALLTAAALAGPVGFSGSVSLSGRQGWISGDDSLTSPVSGVDFALNPTLSLWGLPIGLDVLLSSRESGLRQQLNKFRLHADPAAWAKTVVDAPWLATAVHAIEVGTCYPAWSPLTLSGEPLTGGLVEINPWAVYLAAAAGRTRRAVEYSDTTDAAFERMLYAGKFGVGRKEGSHFFLTGLYARDDSGSIDVPLVAWDTTIFNGDTIVDSLEAITPEENYLVGAELNLDLFDGAFALEGEAAVSQHTRDTRMEVEEWDWLPEWARNTLKPRLSTSVDFAWAARPVLTVLDTRVWGEVEFVGPGYTSLGATGLRRDNFSYGGGIGRDFFDRQLSLAMSLTRERDNNLSSEDSLGNELTPVGATTVFTSWAFDLGCFLRDLPWLQISYGPYVETSESLSGRSRVLSASAGHDFLTGSVSQSPGVSFSYQDFSSTGGQDDYTAWDVGLSHSVGFPFPLTVSAGAGLANTTNAADTLGAGTTTYFELAPGYTLFNAWSNTLSVGGSLTAAATRYDVGLRSFFPVWKICSGELGVTRTGYSGEDGSYGEWYLSAGLSRSW